MGQGRLAREGSILTVPEEKNLGNGAGNSKNAEEPRM